MQYYLKSLKTCPGRVAISSYLVDCDVCQNDGADYDWASPPICTDGSLHELMRGAQIYWCFSATQPDIAVGTDLKGNRFRHSRRRSQA